jgi:hypothetical protein
MNGLWTFMTPDSQAIVGTSMKYKNLYYNLGNLEADTWHYVRNANYIRERLSNDILKIHSKPPIPRENGPQFEHLRPDRFGM